MTSIRLYNSATRQKEEFVPQNPPQVTMYNCGPTVYDYFHVGNARNFVVVDAIRRHLEHRGFEVKFVQNFTDIDDKIIDRANKNGEAWDALAARFTEAYYRNAEALGVRRASVHPCATDHIPHMITLIERLIEKGLAYPTPDGTVYYRVRRLPEYGSLSGKNIDDLMEGAGERAPGKAELEDVKEDPLDFALWKGSKPGEPAWDSPWGAGRPGWHIECSAMSMHHLGETIDIHSGGSDLIFPHHENEQAQSIGATGKPFVRYWLHNGFLTINKEKMSKSLGNFFTIDQVLEKYAPGVVRFYLLSAHYRHPLDYSDKALDEAKSAATRIRDAVTTAERLLETSPVAPTPFDIPASLTAQRTALTASFDEALDDDFNTQRAIGILFEAVTHLNEARQAFTRAGQATGAENHAGTFMSARHAVTEGIQLLHDLLDRLGLDNLLFEESAAETSSGDGALTGQLVDLLIRARGEAKKAKQFQLADMIRDELTAVGIRLQDHPTGTIWLRE